MAFEFAGPALGAALGFVDCATAMLADDGFNGSSCRLGGSVAICIFLFASNLSRGFSTLSEHSSSPGASLFLAIGRRELKPFVREGGGARGPSFRTLLGGVRAAGTVDGWGGGEGGGGVLDRGRWGGFVEVTVYRRGSPHCIGEYNLSRPNAGGEDRGGEEVCV